MALNMEKPLQASAGKKKPAQPSASGGASAAASEPAVEPASAPASGKDTAWRKAGAPAYKAAAWAPAPE
jgi:hypothetical protein